MGTWAAPKSDKDITVANGVIDMLNAAMRTIAPVCGDDDLFDGIDHAIRRIKEMVQEYETSNRD